MALPLNNNVVAAAGVVESDENFVEEYNRERLQKVKNRLDVFDLNNEQLRRIMVILKTGLTQGLRSEQGYTMSPTFITTNTSTINSNSIILDLGGTRFKIYLVDTSGHIIKKTAITIPEEIKNGSIQQLMSFMAVLLKSFLVEHGLPFNFEMPLGFTFSYPCEHNQQSTTSACLLKWTKGFNAFGFAERNIVQLLRDACHVKGIELGLVTIINDTVGTMLACALVNSECSVGIVVATGFNIAYMEKLDNIPKLNDPARMSSNKVICINTEIGSFGDNGLFNDYRNRFDRSLDEDSVNGGEQLLEKMISGMYLGNLMKIVVHDFFNAGLIFNNNPNAITMLEEHNFFITPVITKIEGVMRKSERPLGTIQALINEVGVPLSLTDCAVLAHVCTSICYRAEILCAISVASICEHLESKNITIGVDSSVFYSKTALERLESKIESFIGIDKKITLVRTAEASGRGAAVAAAMDINALQSISWNCGIL